ncbi:MAG: 3-phosphoshikimate 1-carboxyvinyltransferase [bacterium]|nr:3-phosphoshikimate 1-carboxyvinyltransferase [bacterium]
MKKSLKPSEINGTISAPASKSMLQRAIAAALLADSPTRILNATFSNDAMAALRVIKALGAHVSVEKNEILVEGDMNPQGDILDCGEAGLSIRMFTPIAALWHDELTLTGEGSLLTRPVSMIEEPLKKLGLRVTTTNGCPPLTVKGPLQGGDVVVDGSVSSQFLTGFLMALPKAPKDSKLIVNDLKSTPYVDMTITLLDVFGVTVEHENYEVFSIKGNQNYHMGEYRVEGDWSGASFPLVAGGIGGSVTVTCLDPTSPQADRRILDALTAAGAEVRISGDSINVTKKHLKAFHFDATHCPDLFPPLVALACNCDGTTTLTGVERLTHKESNRSETLQKVFSDLGGVIRVKGDLMEVDGVKLTGGSLDSHNDHRIAMAGALAAVNARDDVHIDGYECVNKSYPNFFEDFAKIGCVVYE